MHSFLIGVAFLPNLGTYLLGLGLELAFNMVRVCCSLNLALTLTLTRTLTLTLTLTLSRHLPARIRGARRGGQPWLVRGHRARHPVGRAALTLTPTSP